jgi:hypothetical protein
MAQNNSQVSPSHDAEKEWNMEHLDHEIFDGKVQSTQAARLKLEKQ